MTGNGSGCMRITRAGSGRSPFLSNARAVASSHHERLDGSGYHRGAAAAATRPARLLAAADAYHAMTEPRPHRQALSLEQAADTLGREARAGRLDADVVAAVLESSGQRVPRIMRPAGLTEREAEVVGLLARGLQTKQVARALGVSLKTADRHVQNAYRKIGVSTRAAATLFAMQHGLATWGELRFPAPPTVRSVLPSRQRRRAAGDHAGQCRHHEAGARMNGVREPGRAETVVVGGGQAGLSVGHHLARRGLPFVILDAHARIGDSWRNRWDSLRLFTPARYNGLDGMPFPGPVHSFSTKDEVADYLEAYAARFDLLPVRTGVEVDRISRNGHGGADSW